MYNPIVTSLILCIIIAIISEIYYKVKYKDNIEELDKNDKIKNQISLCIGIFALSYIYLVISNTNVDSNDSIIEDVSEYAADIELENVEPTSVPF